MANVEGALAYAHGQNADPASVGLSANGGDVEVRLTRPATDFVAIVASPTFAIVPPGIDAGPAALTPAGFVGSGAYVLAADSPTTTTITAARGGIMIASTATTMSMTSMRIVLTGPTCRNGAMRTSAWRDSGVNARGNIGDGAICTPVWL